uniref:High arsenic content 1 n=1 Tax=Pteris vittata TaxID=13821 RepID=A0A7G4WFQ6_PTEVI|nr:high arsenic content 1 [Pteris vittata]
MATSVVTTTETTTVSVDVASELLKEGYKYLDVRTQEEFSKGHVEGAINIPFMFKEEFVMVKNANFVDEVSKQLKKDENVVVGCQSGRRSLMAVTDLIAEGFTGMKDMGGGYAAWVQTGHKTCVD